MMESNEQILNAIVDELKEIGLKKMAEELDIYKTIMHQGSNRLREF